LGITLAAAHRAIGSRVQLSRPELAVPAIHAVTGDAELSASNFADTAVQVMMALGPYGAVHLRSKALPSRELFQLAAKLLPAQESTGCLLVVNDRVDVALAVGCGAVQLSGSSLDIGSVRRIAPALAAGVSVHSTEAAAVAERGGAEWVLAGNIHPTASHPGRPGRGMGFVSELAAALTVPVIAIGGVRPEDVEALLNAGASGVAAIRGIWGAVNAGEAAREYLYHYGAHRN